MNDEPFYLIDIPFLLLSQLQTLINLSRLTKLLENDRFVYSMYPGFLVISLDIPEGPQMERAQQQQVDVLL